MRSVAFDLTLTATVQVRELTADEIATARVEFERGFAWVMQEIELSEADRPGLLSAAFEARNRGTREAARDLSRVWPASFRWPRGEAHIYAQRGLAADEARASIDALPEFDLLSAMKSSELRALASEFSVAIKGRVNKPQIVSALLSSGTARHDAIVERVKVLAKSRVDSPNDVGLDLSSLFFERVRSAVSRMRRFDQMEYFFQDGYLSSVYTCIRVQTYSSTPAPCGLKDGESQPRDALMERARQPVCEHLECRCRFNPDDPERVAQRLASKQSASC